MMWNILCFGAQSAEFPHAKRGLVLSWFIRRMTSSGKALCKYTEFMPSVPQNRFRERFGGAGRLFRAPGRVNLIGEHTDYTGGLVMPAAIDFSTWVAAGRREDRTIRAISEGFPGTLEFSLDRTPKCQGNWTDYVAGVAATLEAAGHRLRGANLLIHGEVPVGSGLSSSAAIEVATALALL